MHETAMMEHAKQTHWLRSLLAFGSMLGITAMASCSSGNSVPGGGRVAYAGNPIPAQVPSAEPDEEPIRLRSVGPLSPLDWAILNDCPARPWSKNVPNRACAEDDECGDGFCDRDHCAVIWTCDERYGQRCYGPRSEKSGWCNGLCIEGRCRTCLSDDECVTDLGKADAMCNPYPDRIGGRTCGIHGPTHHN